MMPPCIACEAEKPPRRTDAVMALNGAYVCEEHMEAAFAALAKTVTRIREHGN